MRHPIRDKVLHACMNENKIHILKSRLIYVVHSSLIEFDFHTNILVLLGSS